MCIFPDVASAFYASMRIMENDEYDLLANNVTGVSGTTISGTTASEMTSDKPTVSGTEQQDDDIYYAWMRAMNVYAQQTNSRGACAERFWLIICLNSENFSKCLEMHKSLPMMIPKTGTSVIFKVASNEQQLEEITLKEPNKYVYLTYKVRIQGDQAWRDLLNFLGQHNMLEKHDQIS